MDIQKLLTEIGEEDALQIREESDVRRRHASAGDLVLSTLAAQFRNAVPGLAGIGLTASADLEHVGILLPDATNLRFCSCARLTVNSGRYEVLANPHSDELFGNLGKVPFAGELKGYAKFSSSGMDERASQRIESIIVTHALR